MKLISPLRRWHVLAGLVQSINARSLVEVGCKEGKTTGFLLNEFLELHVTAIDPWGPVENSYEDYQDWDYSKIETEFWQHVGDNKDRCTMLRDLSLPAASTVDDGSQDIVFIDAAHDYDNVLADIKAWWPKVREGGILCGHDFQHKFPGVHRAVAKCFPLLRVSIMPDSVWVVQKTAVELAA